MSTHSTLLHSITIIIPLCECRHVSWYVLMFRRNCWRSMLTSSSFPPPRKRPTAQANSYQVLQYFRSQPSCQDVVAPVTCNPPHSLSTSAMFIRFIYINCMHAVRSCHQLPLPSTFPSFKFASVLSGWFTYSLVLRLKYRFSLSHCVSPYICNCLRPVSPRGVYLEPADGSACAAHPDPSAVVVTLYFIQSDV
jgi:hypothetical protein